VELLLFELRPRSLLPVAGACAIAGFVRPWPIEGGVLFPLDAAPVAPVALLSCLAAGLASGVLAAADAGALSHRGWVHRLPLHWMWWPALGGIAVGPAGCGSRVLGVGYDVIADLLNQHMLVSAALALLLVKAVIWLLALGSGTSGGVLAPLLMMGAGLGLVLAVAAGRLAGTVAAGLHGRSAGQRAGAPLTAIVFAFGLTHAGNALLPLIATTSVAYGVNVLWMKRSIMTEKIARRGLHVHREYGVDPLERAMWTT
jgi:H+/Cl- antiporter ClcA